MFCFRSISDTQLTYLRQACYQSLSAPLDGMWDDLMHRAVVRGIYDQQECIGYYCYDQAYTLINFFMVQDWINRKEEIFSSLLHSEYFPQAFISTNHPCFLTAALPFMRQSSVYYYLFEEGPYPSQEPVLPIQWRDARLVQATPQDIPRVVRFCQQVTDADAAWLTQYIRTWTLQEGIFFLASAKKILGTCELRISATQPAYADLGAIVSPQFRGRGLGTYLMRLGRWICHQRQLKAICSCRYDNVASRKMIERSGFINRHLLMKATLKS